jgi:Xaa-Pro aminopeptidase
MIRIKSDEEILAMKKPGAVVASVFEAIAPLMKQGTSTGYIDRIAHQVIVDAGATPSFPGMVVRRSYRSRRRRVFPSTMKSFTGYRVMTASSRTA